MTTQIDGGISSNTVPPECSFSIGHGLFSLIDAFPYQHPEAPELSVSIPVGTANPADAGRARILQDSVQERPNRDGQRHDHKGEGSDLEPTIRGHQNFSGKRRAYTR